MVHPPLPGVEGGSRRVCTADAADHEDREARPSLVLTYDMWVDGRHISTSLVAFEFEATESGSRLTHAEHGVHLDGFDDGSQREQGTSEIHDALASDLTSERNPA